LWDIHVPHGNCVDGKLHCTTCKSSQKWKYWNVANFCGAELIITLKVENWLWCPFFFFKYTFLSAFVLNGIETIHKCVNGADNFCYMCGEIKFASGKGALTQLIKQAYIIFYQCIFGLFLFNTVIYVLLLLCLCMFMYLHCASWHSSATLTEVFPCFFLSCKANARVKPAKMGHNLH
jgi:hypothetical protein